jgi:carbamoyl-phosphate synthase large subunit
MPKDPSIKKVLVIGSGPIVIGQAAEFDYAGTQACRALKSEGVQVVLINSNPATIMTDREMADRVYLEPINLKMLKKIILRERPDSILPTLGGQTGLNLACELAESGFLDEVGVRLLGTNVEAIKKAEDRELFKLTMQQIGEPVIDSAIVHTVEEAIDFANKAGYPLIVRPAYTLGGTGGGLAEDEEELKKTVQAGLKVSRARQCLIEKSVAGYKEIEYEVIRDGAGNCVIVCSMENVDPVGIHTGDSIVVAPSQTLNGQECLRLRKACINIISSLGISGGCNVQFAVDPSSGNYYLIEVNPRVSRSSALASKATGYPIAKVAALIAIGYNLDEIKNGVTGKTYSCFEPTVDYVVCKFPRWPFDKFAQADRRLGTRMKATGEVMSIGANFEQSFLKALRSLELGYFSTESPKLAAYSDGQLLEQLKVKSDERIFCVCEALRRRKSCDEINRITAIDKWFLLKLKNIVENEEKIKREGLACFDGKYLRKVKRMGFSDLAIARWCGASEDEIRQLRQRYGIKAAFNMVDTCGGEFEAATPYFYSTYEGESEFKGQGGENTVVVLGSGPIRIGQGIEFDYCSVHCVWALKELGYKAVIVNNNPETVSTDSDTADRLYFEPLTKEELANILEAEKPKGVIVQFGGQTAIKLAKAVKELGYEIIGTKLDDIDAAEDRERFDRLLERLNIERPAGRTCFTEKEALAGAEGIGYPVLVRPSYVLGGQGMKIAYDEKELTEFISLLNVDFTEHPLLVDKYVVGKELEVDAISDGEDILIPGIMEHIERAGVHSGDSISVYPALSANKVVSERLAEISKQLAAALHTKGLINIQFILKEGKVYVIEVNPRSSRTVPFISKVTGVPMVRLAVECSLGKKLRELGYGTGLYRKEGVYAVKVPVFSNEKIPSLEISLSPEMKSTGEVLGVSPEFSQALLKGLLASGIRPKRGGAILISVSSGFKQETVPVALGFSRLGFDIYATGGTAHVLNQHFIAASVVSKDTGEIEKLLSSGKISFVINTPTKGMDPGRGGFKIRRLAVELGIPCFTSIDTAAAVLRSLRLGKSEEDIEPVCLQDISDN